MTTAIHSGRRKASALGKARAGRSAYVMNPESLALIENFRLMDDDFMSKCLENARSKSDIGKLMHDFLCSNAAEMYYDILKRQVSQFKNSEEGRHAMCKAVEDLVERKQAESKAEGKREGIAEGKRENMLATAKRMLKSGMLALKDVARYTGLSLAQVTQLKASM